MSGEFFPSDVGRLIVGLGGVGEITAWVDGETVTVNVTQAFSDTSIDSQDWQILGTPLTPLNFSANSDVGALVTVSLNANGWRTADVGKYIEANGGLLQIETVTNSSTASARVIRKMTTDVQVESGAWILKGSMWGGVNGYPRCGVFYQQRLILGGSRGFPLNFWASVIGEYYDFTIGDLDTDAFNYSLATGQFNPILNMSSGKQLIILTSGGEFTVRGGQEKAITPTNIQVSDQSDFGCTEVEPERIGSQLFYVQRSGRKIRAMSANQYDGDQYDSPDVSVISEHITDPGIISLARQAEPQSELFAVRTDGQLGVLTADSDLEVFGWTRQVTAGAFEDVACVPIEGGWSTFFIVSRTINGETIRNIERFDPDANTDSAIYGVSETGSTTWSGLDHLDGRKVSVISSGTYVGDYIVEDGQIELLDPATSVEIGLGYNTTVLTLTPEFSLPIGSMQGSQLSAHEVQVKLRDTIGCYINSQQIPFRKYDTMVLDRPPESFSGNKLAGNLGWSRGEMQTLIQQTLPYPFHLLSVVVHFTSNES